jgi:hypothetical protein
MFCFLHKSPGVNSVCRRLGRLWHVSERDSEKEEEERRRRKRRREKKKKEREKKERKKRESQSAVSVKC